MEGMAKSRKDVAWKIMGKHQDTDQDQDQGTDTDTDTDHTSLRARPRPSAIGEGKEERQNLLALWKKCADFLKPLRMKRHAPSYDKS